MATSDSIALKGGQAANFSDLGGSAIHEQIDSLIYILDSDPKVRVVFLNCYGGLMSMRKMIAVLLKALESQICTKPVVVRCRGQDAQCVPELLAEWVEKHPIYVIDDFDSAC